MQVEKVTPITWLMLHVKEKKEMGPVTCPFVNVETSYFVTCCITCQEKFDILICLITHVNRERVL